MPVCIFTVSKNYCLDLFLRQNPNSFDEFTDHLDVPIRKIQQEPFPVNLRAQMRYRHQGHFLTRKNYFGFFKKWANPGLFFVYFRLFNTLQFKFKFKLKKAQMVCLGIEPGAAGWKARTNPLSYGGTPILAFLISNTTLLIN